MAREMKDSGIPWIGAIPSNWEVQRTKHKYTNHKVVAGDDADGYDRLALTLSGVIKRPKDDATGLQPEAFNGYQILKKNELVFKLIDLANVSTSRVGYSHYTGIVSPAYIVLSPKIPSESHYGVYFFLSMWQREIFNHMGDDGVRSSLNASDLLNIPYLSVPQEEQMRIISFLDRKCAEIDSVIANTQRTIEEYKALKQSIITEAVTKGVRGPRPMKDSGIEWIGEIPEEWEVLPHKYVMHKEKSICEHYAGEDIISLTMNGVIVRDLTAGGKMPTTFDGYQYVEPDDMLLCLFDIDVTPRCVGIVRNHGVTSPAYSRFKVHVGYYNAYYDYLLRFIDDEKAFIHLSKNLRSSLTETDFGAIKTISPSYDEQVEIAAYLDEKCAALDTLIAKKTALLTELEAYKKSLIYEYVTGKREVQ